MKKLSVTKKRNSVKAKSTTTKKSNSKNIKNKKPVRTSRGTQLRPTLGKRVSNVKRGKKKK